MVRVSRRRGLAAGAAVLCGIAALVVYAAVRGGGKPPLEGIVVGAGAGPAVVIGPAGAVGLSVEYPLLAADLGAGPCPPASLVRALRALGSPTLRIGGNSQDLTAPAGSRQIPGITNLRAGFWSRLACLERETAAPVVVGLNLASGQTAWAVAMAAGARSAIPAARLTFELGNEPDIYGAAVAWWNGHALTNALMPAAVYLARARAVAAALGPAAQIEGPDLASGRWIPTVPALVATLHLRAIDAHFYPLDACRALPPTPARALLSRAIQDKLGERVRLARIAHQLRLPAVISESNSISCGGVAGVSDQPVAAVWALRLVLRALRSGFSSVRFHASGGAYDAFVVRHGAITLRPLYLGLLEASRVLTAGSRVRVIPGAGALDGVAVTHRNGSRVLVLSNYASTAKWVLVAAASPVGALSVVARAPTVATGVDSPSGGRARVQLPANSVTAISLAAQPGASR
jgi:hypothetical protein